jgi:fructan beta-fructosidase
MKYFTRYLIVLLALFLGACRDTSQPGKETQKEQLTMDYKESYRPQFHFSPPEKWMNDPNGLVFHKGKYHLFYQYYPDDIVWGPMHWGHAISVDMLHWEHMPIALYPDEHGLIFSGSAVFDAKNTSGLGTSENPPLVAIFTYHDMEAEQQGKIDYQTQGIAFSLDDGATWTKYEGNPVIGNPGIKDFRDPKVFWNEINETWTMLLVAGDHLQIWQSLDLLNWKQVSEFGKDQGAHGGVWECPDLFPLKVEGSDKEKWVLLISINPGAPNGGSGTQYFVGDFDGTTFTSDQNDEKWIDWGTDNYAGVTYNGMPNENRVFIGWMSNWDYARNTPTQTWRSAMTLPRKLWLVNHNGSFDLVNYPIETYHDIVSQVDHRSISIEPKKSVRIPFENYNSSDVQFTVPMADFNMNFLNEKGETLQIRFDRTHKKMLLNRSQSGKTDFMESFSNTIKMPMPNLPEVPVEFKVVMDWSSAEIFVNKGQYALTAQIFPTEFYNKMEITNAANTAMEIKDLQVGAVSRVW